jgi:hypothetical protein
MIVKLVNPIKLKGSHNPISNPINAQPCLGDAKRCPRTCASSGGVYLIIKKNGKYCIPVFKNCERRLNGKIDHQWESPVGQYESKHTDISVTASQEGWEESCGLFYIASSILKDNGFSHHRRPKGAQHWHAICIDDKVLNDHICKKSFNDNHKIMEKYHKSGDFGTGLRAKLRPAVEEMIDITFIGIDEIDRCKQIYKPRSDQGRDCDYKGKNGSGCNFPMNDINGKVCQTNLLSWDLYEKKGYELIEQAIASPYKPSMVKLCKSPLFDYHGKSHTLSDVKTVFICEPSTNPEFSPCSIPVNKVIIPKLQQTETQSDATQQTETQSDTTQPSVIQTAVTQLSVNGPYSIHGSLNLGTSLINDPALFKLLIDKLLKRRKRRRKKQTKKKKKKKRR